MLSWGRRMQRGMLVRRSVSDETDVEYYAVYAPYNTPLKVLARVAGRRWAIEIGQSYCLRKSQCHARERDRSARSLASSASSA
jgi:hypothetical protein